MISKTTASNPCVCCSVGVNVSRGHKTRREPWWGKWVHRSDVERCAGNGRVQDRRRGGMEDSKEEESAKIM